MVIKRKFTRAEKKKIKRIKAIRKKAHASFDRLIKAKAKRIWIEKNKEINILNYPIKLITKRKQLKAIENRLRRTL